MQPINFNAASMPLAFLVFSSLRYPRKVRPVQQLTRGTNHGGTAVETDALSGEELRLVGKQVARELGGIPAGAFALKESGRSAHLAAFRGEIAIDVGREHRAENDAVGAYALGAMIHSKG